MSTPPPQAARPLLATRDLRVRFRGPGHGVAAVDGLSYELSAGRTLAIVGESGAGKTVGCRALMALLPETAEVSGSAKLDGKELLGLSARQMRTNRGAGIAMVFQDPARALNPTMRVGCQVAEAVRAHERVGRRAGRRRATELLRRLGLGAPEQRYFAYPHELSGGMRQRVMLAIALAGRPKLLIADEATRSLDVTTQAQVLELLRGLQQQLGMALILICHDLRLAVTFADDVLVMYAGRALEYAPAARLIESARMPYTQALLDAMPRLDRAPPKQRRMHARPAPLLAARGIVQQFPARGRRGGLFGSGVVQAVAGVSFELEPGETLGLVGETGSGKSTLARALLQAPRPTSGSVRFRGRELTRLRGRELAEHRAGMQIIFQDPFTSLNPAWRVSSIVEEPLAGFGRRSRTERRRGVAEMLELVELPAATYGHRRARELSGGQCQRVAIARALASEPALIICDEGLASLDVLIQAQTLNLLEHLRAARGLSYLFISHDLAVVNQVSDRIAVMYLGRLCEVGPAESIHARPSHPYTAALLACLPGTAPARFAPAVAIRGDPVSPIDPPSGCAFRTRCPRAERRCALETPRLRAVDAHHFAACHFPLAAGA